MLPAYNHITTSHATAPHHAALFEPAIMTDTPAPARSDPMAESFEVFWDKNRGLFIRVCLRAIQSGLMEEADIPGEVYIAWETAREKWNPDLARFSTLALNVLRYQLYERYPNLYQAPEHYQIADGETDALPSPALKITREAGEATTESDAPVQDDPEALYGSCHVVLSGTVPLPSVIALHPIWHHQRYRTILRGMIDPSAPRDPQFYRTLADQLALTERRVRQLVQEATRILAHPDIVRDSALPLQSPVSEDSAGIRFVRLDALQPPELAAQQFRAVQKMTRLFRVDQRILVPLIIDQNGRIIDGWTRFAAAAQLRLATVPVLLHPVRDSRSNHYDDPLYWQARRRLAGRNKPLPIQASHQMRMF
ncbi:hypothetical protein JKG47_00965 [Acidithiobacillus sp. MC6.1]|nr:hypothetical protein [Acidithiobacillus sp. MC6.1]